MDDNRMMIRFLIRSNYPKNIGTGLDSDHCYYP